MHTSVNPGEVLRCGVWMLLKRRTENEERGRSTAKGKDKTKRFVLLFNSRSSFPEVSGRPRHNAKWIRYYGMLVQSIAQHFSSGTVKSVWTFRSVSPYSTRSLIQLAYIIRASDLILFSVGVTFKIVYQNFARRLHFQVKKFLTPTSFVDPIVLLTLLFPTFYCGLKIWQTWEYQETEVVFYNAEHVSRYTLRCKKISICKVLTDFCRRWVRRIVMGFSQK